MESGDYKKSSIITSPLFDNLCLYLEEANGRHKQVFIFVPYIQTSILEKILENISTKVIIITTWHLDDLLSGSSELSLYPFCKKRGITLYINNRIHFKVYSVGLDDMILATGNISKRGLGTIPDSNYECATYVNNLNNDDRYYFARIQKEALHVDDEMYEELKKWYDKQEKKIQTVDEFDRIITSLGKDEFLISALPMTRNIDILGEAYFKINNRQPANNDDEIRDCVFHDLANYNIPLGLTKSAFKEQLKNSFFSHPFIKKIDEFIAPEAYFGRIKEWVQKNCTDVPIPSRRELTGNIQVLLEWFEKLGDGKYVVNIPGEHSQRIRRVKP